MKTPSLLFTAALLALSAGPGRSQTPDPGPEPTATPAGFVAAFQASNADPLPTRQTRAAARLSAEMLNGERQLLVNFRTLYAEVWHNRDGLTPQQVCDGLGSKAANLFVIAGTLANAIYQIDPAGIGAMVNVPAGYTATINADGTVLVAGSPAPSPTPTPAGTP